ncbi:MAG: CRISPR-associated protein Cas4 [Roseiflexaceae bacterium]|nr:CRISPR-associated protein Cas4 [Roseiflexaceae bacterium]
MDESIELDVLISALEHYSYCPRQCALIHVEQTFDENVYTIKGQLMHQRVDSGDDTPNRGTVTDRAIPLWSERYRLRGKADAVEWHAGVPLPVEYKLGRRHGVHADIQLCAQALCLEEMLDVVIPYGIIYEGAARRRSQVAFDQQLRTRTIEMIAAIRTMLINQTLPPAPNDARCPNCSLIHSCLPDVVAQHERLRMHQRALFRPQPLAELGV